jgi:hypothetical protein
MEEASVERVLTRCKSLLLLPPAELKRIKTMKTGNAE